MKKDLQYYKNLGVFNNGQLEQLEYGLEDGLDVSIFANPVFNSIQMSEIRYGLVSNFDVSIYADTKFDWWQMRQIYGMLSKREDPTEYITKITILNL